MNLIQRLNIQGRFTDISRRFPVVLVFALITTLTLILMIDDNTGKIFRWPVSGFLGFLAALSWSLYSEANQIVKKNFWFGVATIILLTGVYFYIMPDTLNPDFNCFWFWTLGLSIILHLLVSLAPYVHRYEKTPFVNYNIGLFTGWMKSALFAILLFTALSLAILALDQLFDIQIKGIIYFKLFILVTGLLQSTLFLSEIPENYDDVSAPSGKSAFQIIVFYIFIPVTILYGLIIYAYAGRVILTSHQMVKWTYVMILWYFGVGLLAWLCAAYFDDHLQKQYPLLFRKWFFPFSILPVILLFVSVYNNIDNSGIKEEYYLSGFIAFFIALIVIFYLKWPSKDLRVIPALAILFCGAIFWSGPFSICAVPVKNQQKKLIIELEKSGLIQNNTITVDTLKAYMDTDGLINQKLYYLDTRNALGFLKDYDKNNVFKTSKDSLNMDNILAAFHLNYGPVQNGTYFEYSKELTNSYDISGFDKILPLTSMNDTRINTDYIKVENNFLILYLNGVEVAKIDIIDDIDYLSENQNAINVIDKKAGKYLIKIIVTSASGLKDKGLIKDVSLSGHAFIKIMK
ncbi:MAG: hypothetical protein WBP08_11895 [Saprospiraceae bacterium]|nr:DUF4153 domain-containing protein [Saprospiraceae bacterium]